MLLRIGCLVAAIGMLAACGGGASTPSALIGPTASPQSIYVSTLDNIRNVDVMVYVPSGVAQPTMTRSFITGNVAFPAPGPVAVDSAGYVYDVVSSAIGGCVTQIYAPNATGKPPPLLTLPLSCGPLAIDRNNNYYAIGTPSNGLSTINVYPPIHSSTLPSPLRTFSFTNPASNVVGIAVDPSGNVYVALSGSFSAPNSSVEVFSAGATGTVHPTRALAGTNTTFGTLTAITVDLGENLYVSSYDATTGTNRTILEFPPGSSGDVAPSHSISIGSGNNAPAFQLAADTLGNIYAAAADLYIFSPGLKSTIAVITVATPGLAAVRGVAIGP